MNCDDKQAAFQNTLASVQAQLKAELDAITSDTEAKAKEIADDFEADQDLAGGVGAGVGTVLGGAYGGVPGATVGAAVGKLIGSLFTLEVGMHRQVVSLDVPQTTMKTKDFSFDLPTVVVRDTDISFDLPTIEMRRQRGPDIPETVVKVTTRCIKIGWPVNKKICTDIPETTIRMKETYFDMPVTVMKTTRIVLGLPSIEMRRQEFKMDIPEITMKRTEFSADVPYITLRFVKDAGKRTAAAAAALAQAAQDSALQRQVAFKDRLRMEVAPLCVDMFACFRQVLEENRRDAAARFPEHLDKLTAAVSSLKAKAVPDNDPNMVSALATLNDAIAQRDAALKPFDDAIAELAASAKASLEQFLETTADPAGSKDLKIRPKVRGGLISITDEVEGSGNGDSRGSDQPRTSREGQAPRRSIPGLVGYAVVAP